MKKLFVLLAVSVATAAFGSVVASAQGEEKVVTGTVTLLNPSMVKILDEYMAGHLYSGTGTTLGLNVKLGAIYRKTEGLSWDVYYTAIKRPKILDRANSLPALANPANTQNLDYTSYNFGYGTYYNWKIGKKLMLKTGGMLDLYGASKESTPDGVNNSMNLEGQIMIKSHSAIKYGWDFKKWALDLRASITLPVIGLISADHPSEPALAVVGANDHRILRPEFRHVFLGFYHNYMSLDFDLGIDFVLKPCTLSLGLGNSSKWWKVYDVQNIRKITCTTLGISFDIVSRDKFKSSNRNF